MLLFLLLPLFLSISMTSLLIFLLVVLPTPQVGRESQDHPPLEEQEIPPCRDRARADGLETSLDEEKAKHEKFITLGRIPDRPIVFSCLSPALQQRFSYLANS